LDNVSTNQIHKAREILTKGNHKGEMVVGKNTLIKKALKFVTQKPDASDPDYEDHSQWSQDAKLTALIPLMVENVGLVFSEEPYAELREKIEAEKIAMPARTGVPAPCDVIIPEGPTGVEVGKIDLFHKLNFQCKTVKAAIEVVKPMKIIHKGEKVGEGATQLCKLLNIVPFEYSLTFKYVYVDGVVLNQDAIETPAEETIESFKNFANYLTALSLGADIPNALSVPQFIANGFKSLLAIGMETGYSFAALEAAKNAASNVQATAQTTSGPAETKKEEAKVEEPEEESEDMDMGGLFD